MKRFTNSRRSTTELPELEDLLKCRKHAATRATTELIDILVDMHRTGALGYTWDELDGKPMRVWYATKPEPFLRRPSECSCEVTESMSYLFLEGKLEFFIRRSDWEVPFRLRRIKSLN